MSETNCRLSFLKTIISFLFYSREAYLRLYKILFSFYIILNYLKLSEYKQKISLLKELLISILTMLHY